MRGNAYGFDGVVGAEVKCKCNSWWWGWDEGLYAAPLSDLFYQLSDVDQKCQMGHVIIPPMLTSSVYSKNLALTNLASHSRICVDFA